MKCRLIDSGFNNAFTNMAIDEAILSYSKIPTLRIYFWKPQAVSIGYAQSIKEINSEYCKKNNIDIVRRITGGMAVFHQNELTYSFIVPKDSNLLPKDIAKSYKKIAEALVMAFNKMGINAEMKKIPERIKTPICFLSSNWHEILVNGKKISGSAQKRFENKVLQHGSIIIDFDYKKNSLIFNTKENLRNRITSINNELSNKVDINHFKNSIKFGFGKIFDFYFAESELTDKEFGLAKKLIKNKYSAIEWNFGL